MADRSPSAARSSASSQLASRRTPCSRTSGRVSLAYVRLMRRIYRVRWHTINTELTEPTEAKTDLSFVSAVGSVFVVAHASRRADQGNKPTAHQHCAERSI